MNNSETQFPIRAVKVEEVICVLRRIIGQPFFFKHLGVNHMVCRSREFWLLSKENFNISTKQTSIFKTGSDACEKEPGLCVKKTFSNLHILMCPTQKDETLGHYMNLLQTNNV